MKYKILPHSADGKFQAFGRTLEEAFSNAALATAFLMWDWSKVRRATSYKVRVRARDLEQLLVKFLGEVVYLLETRSFLLGAVEELRLREGKQELHLEARFWGDRISEKYDIYGNVKAVTYNEMKIKRKGRVTLQVVVDM
jgi:SHS2 domain-containing protein